MSTSNPTPDQTQSPTQSPSLSSGLGQQRLPRRTVVATAATAAALAPVAGLGARAAAAPSTVAAPTARDRAVFQHGVASGDPLPDAVVLWTRVTPIPEATPGSEKGPRTKVAWEIATDPAFRHVVRSGRLETSASRDHTVKVDATGLRPATDHWFRFHAAGATSPIGRTRTAPAAGAAPRQLRFGVVSCSNYPEGYFSAYRHLAAREDLDAVVHLGDYLYEYENKDTDLRSPAPALEILSLADYRQRHASYKQDPDLMALHGRVPFITVWDDHEVANNSWKGGAENHDPATEGDYGRRMARAHRAYDEWMPVRLDGTARLGDGTRLYRTLAYGTLAEFVLMDLRTYRDEQTSVPVDPAVASPERSITGATQMAWLKRRLSTSRAQWKLLGNSVMIAPLSLAAVPRQFVDVLDQLAGPFPAEATINSDQWDGYTADRRLLFDHIAAESIEGVVALTGDIHTAWAMDLPVDTGTYPTSGTVGVEFVVPSVTSDNFDDILGVPPHTVDDVLGEGLLAANRHIKYVNLDDHGYGVLTVTAASTQMDYWMVSDKADPEATVAWDAGYVTQAGSGTVAAAAKPVS
ncbi:alkaline phosphatase D family protein [Nocardioides fonticola]|uniref:Alkaline phosphatase D family protein n=1 Tax=Nocardioides fonticola TaxID=450363 RepID=A0ABP7XB42_9ACTN